LPFNVYDADHFIGPIQHLFSGGLMLGAFFIATDPTSGCSSHKGQLIFGAGVAIMTVLVREFGNFPDAVNFDTLTQATPLDSIKTGINQEYSMSEITSNPLFGDFGGLGWEWIANFYFFGGIFLIYKRVITWRVPSAVILTTIAFSLPFNVYDADHFIGPIQHLFSGGLMLGAFFIATDPTSGCSSHKGQLIFGAGVAIMTVLVREFGNFPDGVAFGVLLMNMAAPLIDRLTIPQSFGQNKNA